MGKLNIAHHKSYHPYRRDNIERVRRDEEEARDKEAAQEDKIVLAEAEARVELLRQRAGLTESSSSRPIAEQESVEAGSSSLSSSRHINLFEDLERTVSVDSRATKSASTKQSSQDLGIPLAPSEKDRRPWYSDRERGPPKELDGDRQVRELARKSAHDPLTNINKQLAARSGDGDNAFRRINPPSWRHPPSVQMAGAQPEVAERLGRESSERQRAQDLIRRKKREMEGSATPSAVRSGMGGGYRDVFNRREVEAAHRSRRWEPQYPRDPGGRR